MVLMFFIQSIQYEDCKDLETKILAMTLSDDLREKAIEVSVEMILADSKSKAAKVI